MKPPAVGGVVALAVVAGRPDGKGWCSALFRPPRRRSDAADTVPRFPLRWNRGISFSLFRPQFGLGADCSGRADLGGDRLARLVVVLVPIHAFRRSVFGLIIGGALGNAIDRIAHGAVIDYLDLHAFGRHFFVFNGADAAINLGVALAILDLLLVPARRRGARPVARAEFAKDSQAVSRPASQSHPFGIAEICREIRRRRSVVAMPAEGKRYRGWALVYGQRRSLWR